MKNAGDSRSHFYQFVPVCEFLQEMPEEQHRVLNHTVPDDLLRDLIDGHAITAHISIRQQVDDGKDRRADTGREERLGLLHVVEVFSTLFLPCTKTQSHRGLHQKEMYGYFGVLRRAIKRSMSDKILIHIQEVCGRREEEVVESSKRRWGS